jgi:hypothetical protein
MLTPLPVNKRKPKFLSSVEEEENEAGAPPPTS